MSLSDRPDRGRRPTWLALGCCLLLALVGVGPRATRGADSLPQRFEADFTKGEFDIRDLALSGGHAEELVQAEPKGLRIKIPPNMNKPEGVGIRTRSPIRGDFDITATFDILRAEKPTEGYGIGAQMWLETESPTHESVTAEWTYTPGKDGTRFISTRIRGKADGQREYIPRSLPAARRSGTLRLVRTGGMIRGTYQEEGATERSIPPVALGTEDVSVVKVQANTGSSDHPLEIRLRSFTVAADALPGWANVTGSAGPTAAPTGSEPPALARPIVLGLLVAVAVAGLVALGAALARRRPTPGATASGPPAVGGEAPATWDDEPLAALEALAEAFGREHPAAEVFFEPGHCQFTLRSGVVDGPCVVWWRVEASRLKRAGQTWDDVRRQLPKRYRGQYRAGQRDGTWQTWDTTGGTASVTFRQGERV